MVKLYWIVGLLTLAFYGYTEHRAWYVVIQDQAQHGGSGGGYSGSSSGVHHK